MCGKSLKKLFVFAFVTAVCCSSCFAWYFSPSARSEASALQAEDSRDAQDGGSEKLTDLETRLGESLNSLKLKNTQLEAVTALLSEYDASLTACATEFARAERELSRFHYGVFAKAGISPLFPELMSFGGGLTVRKGPVIMMVSGSVPKVAGEWAMAFDRTSVEIAVGYEW